MDTFTKETVLRSFEVTGIAPHNPSIIVDKFAQESSEDSSGSSDTSVYSGKDWLKIESLVRRISTDQSNKNTHKILRSLHHISIQNQLLNDEILGLRSALKWKEKHSKKSHTLPLQQRQEYHGGAVMWSPSKRREAEHLHNVVQRLDMEEKLRKVNDKEVAATKKLVQEKEKEEKRVQRKVAAEARKKKKKEEHAIQVATRKAERERQKQQRNATNALQFSQKGKRKASQDSTAKKRQKRVSTRDADDVPPLELPPSPSYKITTRGRNVTLPKKYR